MLAGTAAFVRVRGAEAERRHPPAGQFLEVDGVRLHYVERGEGPPLVLLHGLGSMADDFLVSGLVAQAQGRYRVLAFDRPGYGFSTRPPGRTWSPAAQARLVLAALRKLDVNRPIVLGHSWGTSVAISLALAAPGFPRSLVLASGLYFPSPRVDAPLLIPPALPLIGALLRRTVSPLAGRALWPLWLRMLFAPTPVPAAMAALAWKALRPQTLRAVGEEAMHLLPFTIRAARMYPKLTLPVVLVAGASDGYVSTRFHTMRLYPIVPNAQLVIAGNAGHMVHHSDPALVLGAVDRAAWGASTNR
jgi:pimeloyl-ACP methyl ester carboxylesterase